MPPVSTRGSTQDPTVPFPPDAYTLFCEYELSNNRALDQFKDNQIKMNKRLAELWFKARTYRLMWSLEFAEKARFMIHDRRHRKSLPRQNLPSNFEAFSGLEFFSLIRKEVFECTRPPPLDMWNEMGTAEKEVYLARQRGLDWLSRRCDGNYGDREFGELLSFLPLTPLARDSQGKAYWGC